MHLTLALPALNQPDFAKLPATPVPALSQLLRFGTFTPQAARPSEFYGRYLWQGSLLAQRREPEAKLALQLQSLALTYRQFAGGNPAAYVSNPSDFNFVDGVRLGVAIRTPAPREVGDTGVTWITRNASATVGVRSRSL